MSRLIETYGGEVLIAPAMREVPVPLNEELREFGAKLLSGGFDSVIFLTGAGARALVDALGQENPTEKVLEALRKVTAVARGPKPLAVLREWQVPVAATAAEPNTWREVVKAIDEKRLELREKTVAVQEYGVSNAELLEELRRRGARAVPVSVYQWALPEDLGPLRAAVREVIEGRVDVALFTTGVQAAHFFRVAEEMGKKAELQAGLERVMKASVGPSTTKVLESYGLKVEVEATHPKMGYLVKEAAEQAAAFFKKKQKTTPAAGAKG